MKTNLSQSAHGSVISLYGPLSLKILYSEFFDVIKRCLIPFSLPLVSILKIVF